MIFAKFNEYPPTQDVLKVLEEAFKDIEWGDQGTLEMPDAYFWISQDNTKVAVDNLSSHEFQIKCAELDVCLVQIVINELSAVFSIKVLKSPEFEPHE